MKVSFRSAIIITAFTFGAQLILFASQIVTASLFGASTNMDAFLAANTLPQYIITVLLSSLGFVFIPFFIESKTKGSEEKAYDLAASLFNNTILVLTVVTILGIIFTKPLLRLTTPGLSGESIDIAFKVALITWPTVLGTGAVSILSSIYQAEKKFSWQAAVPFIGALINLILLIILAPQLGVIGLAIATSMGVFLQAYLLLRVITRRGPYNFNLNWNDPTLLQIARLLVPLVIVAALTKFTPILDRYLASGLHEGSISHLNYAFKITTFISLLISTGGTTVIFPKMALDVSSGDLNALRNTLSLGLRIMWLITAPIIAIGIPLSLPFVTLLFNRGEFMFSDSVAVADLLKIYFFSLIAICLGNVTGKGFYVLRDTKTLAIMGVLEALAYTIYTIYFTKWLGVSGIGLGFTLYYTVSLVWQLFVLNYKTGNRPSRTIIKSFSKTIVAAVVAGFLTFLLTGFISDLLIQFLVGGSFGVLTYAVVLYLLGSKELKVIKSFI